MIQPEPVACPIEAASTRSSSRRGFVFNALMVLGVVAGYGLGLWHFLRYLVPLGRGRQKREMFVGTLADLPVGASRTVRDPRGEEIALARVANDPEHPERGFKALSSKCPHLGCRVHWQAGEQRFFCPCHNGVFDKNGVAISGPPAKENKNLSEFEVRVRRDTGWVFIMVQDARRLQSAGFHGSEPRSHGA